MLETENKNIFNYAKNFFKNYYSLVIILLFFVLCTVYLGIFKDNIFVPVYDTLDDFLIKYKLLYDNNLFWDMNGVVPLLQGIDRKCFFSSLKLISCLFMIMPNFWAFITLIYLKIIFSICGFFFLGKLTDKDFNSHINEFLFVGFLYGLTTPFMGEAISVATLPLLTCLLILFYRKPDWKLCLLFLIYPFFSSLIFFAPFIFLNIFIFLLIDKIKTGKFKFYMLLPVVFMGIGYIITEYNLIWFFLTAEDTIRSEFIIRHDFNFVGRILKGFIIGDLNSGHAQRLVFPVCLLYFIYLNFTLLKNKNFKNFLNIYNVIFIILLINSFFYSLYFSTVYQHIVGSIPLIGGFKISRTMHINLFLWYVEFLIVVINLPKTKFGIYAKKIILFLAFFVLVFCAKLLEFNIYRENIDFIKNKIMGISDLKLSYNQFYSPDLFEKIKKDINYNKEWSVAFGFEPAILEYNQIWTLDGYLSYYPLKYKRQFENLIGNELKINKKYKKEFDEYGAHAYIISNAFKNNYGKIDIYLSQAQLNINKQVFKDMNGVYVFSRVEITNFKDLDLTLIDIYTDKTSPYVIYVYKIVT